MVLSHDSHFFSIEVVWCNSNCSTSDSIIDISFTKKNVFISQQFWENHAYILISIWVHLESNATTITNVLYDKIRSIAVMNITDMITVFKKGVY